jgi:hypothetical protein
VVVATAAAANGQMLPGTMGGEEAGSNRISSSSSCRSEMCVAPVFVQLSSGLPWPWFVFTATAVAADLSATADQVSPCVTCMHMALLSRVRTVLKFDVRHQQAHTHCWSVWL